MFQSLKTELKQIWTLQDKLKNAIEAQNVDGQVSAQEQMARLSVDAARLGQLKAAEEAKKRKRLTLLLKEEYTTSSNRCKSRRMGS